jgi:hypothetical protein
MGTVQFPWSKRARPDKAAPAGDASLDHLSQFVATRRGVEAWIEQPNTFTKPSMLLIAYDGEWTRRSIPDVKWGRKFASKRGVPAYDAGVVPYPQRMRDFNARRKSS